MWEKSGNSYAPIHLSYNKSMRSWVINSSSGILVLKGFNGFFVNSNQKLDGSFGGKTYDITVSCYDTKWAKHFFLV